MRAPLVLPAVAALAGIALAGRLTHAATPLAVALVACGLALRGPAGRLVAWAGCGLIAAWGWGGAGRPLLLPDPERPVTLVGSPAGTWERDGELWRLELAGERLRQGDRVVAWPQRVRLSIAYGERPPTAERLRVRGYLRRSPPLANGLAAPPGPWRLHLKSAYFLECPEGGRASRWLRLRRTLRARVEKLFEEQPDDRPGPWIAQALVLGRSAALPGTWRRALRRTGLSHLLALSGLHVGLLAALAAIVGLWLPRGLRWVPVAMAVALYLALAGPRPGLLRASAMVLAALAALRLERPPHGANALAGVAGGLALAWPELTADLGFVLTMAATGGIVALTPHFERRWRGLPALLRRPLAVSCGAQLATLPWVVASFRLWCPLAPLWNLLAVPWTALALAGSFAWIGVALVSPPAGRLLLPLLDALAWPFGLPAALPPGLLAPLPLDGVPLALGWGAGLLLAAGATWALLRPASWRRWLALVTLVALLWPAGEPAALPELAMLDVGQGEALLLRDGGEAMLVDGGGWRRADLGGRVLLPVLATLGVRSLRAVVLTHPDRDHCGGLLDLASYLPIGEVRLAPGWREAPCARDLLTLAGVVPRTMWAGETMRLGRWRLSSLHPAAGERRGGNNRSLVLLAETAGRRVLLTGDLEASGEARLARRSGAWRPRLDVLKVAHHGSRTSTTASLLRATRPRLALISAGVGNRYGHPAAPVLERLGAAGVRVLRTDRHGLVRLRFTADGRLLVELPASPRPLPAPTPG